MSQREWSLAAAHDVVAEAVPDREMLVCGDVRRTFSEVRERSRGLASFLVTEGIGLRRERSELERWECGQDAVALVLHNGAEYIEAQLGAYRARAVPFNVNQHYRAAELGALLTDVGARVAFYHRQYGPLLADAVDATDLVLIDVDDGSGVEPLPGSTSYEAAVGTLVSDLPDPSPDDLCLVCTGGTTGRPKAVLWRQADIYVSAMAGVEGLLRSRSGPRPRPAPWDPGTPSRPSCTPPRSGRPTRASTVGARSWSTTTLGPLTRAWSSR